MAWNNPYRNINAGKRDDLPKRVRSTWEANVWRTLLFLEVQGLLGEIAYEPERLEYKVGKGTGRLRRYSPDFRVRLADGTLLYLEVKGRYSLTDQRKMEAVVRLHPDKAFVLVDTTRYYTWERLFARQVPNWEGGPAARMEL